MPYPNEPTFPTERARRHAPVLRADGTPPEGVLWSSLRGRRLGGFKFRRQHPIGPFVVDFYCEDAKLVVEIDSSYHHGRQQKDAARDAWMKEHSISVLRITASELAKNETGVVMRILSAAQQFAGQRTIEDDSD